jgi:hypothetical protein
MERHDPLAPADTGDADIEADSIDQDSSGVDLSFERETADGTPTARAQAETDARTQTRTETTPLPKPAADDDADDDTETDAERQAARDERGRFTKPKTDAPATDKKPDRFERRIARKRDEINGITREITKLRTELTELQQQKQAITGKPASENPTTAAQAKKELGPRPSWKDFEAQGKSYDEFEQAKDEWVLAEAESRALARIEARQQEERQAAEKDKHAEFERAQTRQYAERLDAFKAAHPDYEQVVANLDDLEPPEFVEDVIKLHPKGLDVLYHLGQYPDLAEALEDAVDTLTNPMFDAVMTSDNPAAFIAALASDASERTRIARLSPRQQLVELGRFEARLSASANGSRRPVPGSKAAPPPSHRAGSHSAGATRASSADSESVDDYIARRKREEHEARRSRSA